MKEYCLKLIFFTAALGMGTVTLFQGKDVYAAEAYEAYNTDAEAETASDDMEEQENAITDYPAYDEIIRKYYEGMTSGWSMEKFAENNLCYLVGFEMGENALG